eukprot:TRINITY_DN15888_c0_g1_i1.p1 TRINITY_DN15888_c0_g1~~TRINITY_DN15888_c0_g1_i1.p1  ORF type:complete len:340 (-),score=54.20 TRINITY_DN15888_c0_g1_i1:118-1137(-)
MCCIVVGGVIVYDALTGKQVHTLMTDFPSKPRMHVSRSHKTVLCEFRGDSGFLAAWNVASSTPLQLPKQQPLFFVGLAGDRYAVLHDNQSTQLYRYDDDTPVYSTTERAAAFVLSDDESLCVLALKHNAVYVVDTGSGQVLFSRPSSDVHRVSVSPTNRLVAVSGDGATSVLDVASGKCVYQLDVSSSGTFLANGFLVVREYGSTGSTERYVVLDPDWTQVVELRTQGYGECLSPGAKLLRLGCSIYDFGLNRVIFNIDSNIKFCSWLSDGLFLHSRNVATVRNAEELDVIDVRSQQVIHSFGQGVVPVYGVRGVLSASRRVLCTLHMSDSGGVCRVFV